MNPFRLLLYGSWRTHINISNNFKRKLIKVKRMKISVIPIDYLFETSPAVSDKVDKFNETGVVLVCNWTDGCDIRAFAVNEARWGNAVVANCCCR
jgi:hypothetical protein